VHRRKDLTRRTQCRTLVSEVLPMMTNGQEQSLRATVRQS
jgi:hypothetical protein